MWRCAFSILLGSNLASTMVASACPRQPYRFQYPPRIEPRFNNLRCIDSQHYFGLSVSSSDRTSLQPCLRPLRVRPNNVFQYPPRIEPRFNSYTRQCARSHWRTFSILLGSNLASTFARRPIAWQPCGLSVSSSDRTSLQRCG